MCGMAKHFEDDFNVMWTVKSKAQSHTMSTNLGHFNDDDLSSMTFEIGGLGRMAGAQTCCQLASRRDAIDGGQ